MKKQNLVYLIGIRNKDETKILPFGLMYLSKALKQNGFNVKVVHCSISKFSKEVYQIVKDHPLFVGFSVLTGGITYDSAKASKLIKTHLDIPVVWGGVHPSIMPRQCLNEPYIDFVVIGEGEQTIVNLAKEFLKRVPNFKKICGLGFKNKGFIQLNPQREFIHNLDKYSLDFECVNIPKYILTLNRKIDGKSIKTTSIDYYSSRGCPFDCAFCYNKIVHKRLWRTHSVNHIIKDINFLKEKYHINEIFFWDDNFWADPERALSIISQIDIYSGFEIRIDAITEKLLTAFKRFKVRYLLVGGESGSNRILKLINKGFSAETLLEKAKLLEQFDMPVQYSFIIYFPTETKYELNETLDLMLQIQNVHKRASFTVGMFIPYPGTALFNLSKDYGFIEPKKTEEWRIFDRWKNLVPLPWANKHNCLIIRHLFALISCSNWIIKKWLIFRIKKRFFNFSFDLKILILYDLFKKKIKFILKDAVHLNIQK